MTGGTLLLKQGDTYYLTKVAHDGFDLQDKAEQIKIWSSLKTPQEIIVAFLRGRKGIDFEPLDIMTDDVYLCFYKKEYDHSINYNVAINDIESEINLLIEKENLDDDHPFMQLGCDYSDYIFFLDMDTGIVTLNDETI